MLRIQRETERLSRDRHKAKKYRENPSYALLPQKGKGKKDSGVNQDSESKNKMLSQSDKQGIEMKDSQVAVIEVPDKLVRPNQDMS